MTTSAEVQTLVVRIPFEFKRRGGRKLIITPEGAPAALAPPAAVDETLVRTLIKAHRWRRRIETGKAKSITDLAEQEKVTIAYVTRLLPLTCLAPDIVAAILGGRQPRGLSVTRMLYRMYRSRGRSSGGCGSFQLADNTLSLLRDILITGSRRLRSAFEATRQRVYRHLVIGNHFPDTTTKHAKQLKLNGGYSMFWSGETLEAAIRADRLIEPFDPKRIDCAAYTLSVGDEVYISPTVDDPQNNLATVRVLGKGDGFVIPAGQFSFLITDERVIVPNNAIAFISMKATWKFRGLVNVSGFHVDPGYVGKIIFSVFNAGPRPVHVRRGDQFFLIWYACLDKVSKKTRDMPSRENIDSSIINGICGEIHSLEALSNRIIGVENRISERISETERKHTALLTKLAAVGTGLIVLISVISAIFSGIFVQEARKQLGYTDDQQQAAPIISSPSNQISGSIPAANTVSGAPLPPAGSAPPSGSGKSIPQAGLQGGAPSPNTSGRHP